jgi:PAS domain S-box-containing protein
MRNKLIFSSCLIIIFFFLTNSLVSQDETGNPFITNYYSKDYKAHAQNWSVTQDDRGIMYIANGDGILTFDGQNWELIPLPNNVTVRSICKSNNGIIYVGSLNEFGYLRPNSLGKIEYVSLHDSLGIEKISTIWDIYNIDDDVYFRSNEYLIRYRNKVFKTWKAKTSFSICFKYKNKLYIHETAHGLFELHNDSLVLAPSGLKLKGKQLNFGFEVDDEVVLANRQQGLLIYDGNQVRIIKGEASNFFKEHLVYDGTKNNSNNEIIAGTATGGIIIINKKGEILREINVQSGLQSNNIHEVFVDNDNHLWLGLNKGIAKCEVSIPISFWNQSNGLPGMLLNAIRFENTLYIATHQGLSYLENNKVIEIPEKLSQTWNLLSFNVPNSNKKRLLVSSNSGIYEIRNKKLFKISNRIVGFTMTQSKSNPSIIYVGFRENIGVLEYKNNKFKYIGKLPYTILSVRSIEEDKNGNIWASTFRHGVVKIKLSEDVLNPLEIVEYGTADGFPSLKNILIYNYKNELAFGTEFGLYKYNKEHDNFYKDETFKNIFQEKQKDIFSFVEDLEGNVWISQLNNKAGSIGIAKKNINEEYTWNSSIFNRIPEMMVLMFYVEDNGTAWIGGSEGLFKYDPNVEFNFDKKLLTLIRRVEINSDSTVFFGNYFKDKNDKRFFSLEQSEQVINEFEYKDNSLTFYYAAPDFNSESDIEYQYCLIGYEEEWSDWSLNTKKEYTNLSKGSYTFKVRAQNIYNQVSNEAYYEFTILPPWYQTTIAFLGYILLGIALIYIIVKISIRRLKNLNTELERLVEKRTFEINQQKDEILAQSDELERNNAELEKLSIVARETDNAIAIANPKGLIEWVNEGFTRLYGYTLDDLEKLGYKTMVDFSLGSNIAETINYCLTSKKSKIYESLNHSKSGNNIWAQTTITPILDDNENVIKLIAIDSDISKLKLTEIEVMQQKDEIQAQRDFARQQKEFIEDQNKELEKHRNRLEQLVKERTIDLEIAKEKAEQSDKLKSAFLANMSHEIRTPMNAIIGFSNLLNDNEIDPRDKSELVSHIIHNSNTLLHLIDDIIDIAKIEAGQLEINKKNCQINKILNELFETFSEKKKLLHHKDIDLIFKPGIENLNFTTYTDPIRIQQILTNLIDNALKFTDKGKIEITYILKEEKENSFIEFYVKDTGIGLSKDQQSQIFSRFTKFENDKKKLYRGAGLGLAICKNISNLLGGDIWIESEPKKGSTFYFTIPYLKVSEDDIILKKDQKENIYNWANKSILVAEDEESNFLFMEMLLSKTNVNILRAKDGVEAVEKFQKNNIDLILMDIKMPNMDGLEATRRIRKIDKDIVIIAQTAFAMENDEKISINAGCNDYIAKPIRKPKLLKLINKYLT